MGRATHYEQPDQYTGVFVVSCDADGTGLARRPSQQAAETLGNRRECPACGTRPAGRLPGRTSLETDQDVSHGRRPATRRR